MTEDDTFDALRRVPREDIEKIMGESTSRVLRLRCSSVATDMYPPQIPLLQTLKRSAVFTAIDERVMLEDIFSGMDLDSMRLSFSKTGWTPESYVNFITEKYVRRLEHNRSIDFYSFSLLILYFCLVILLPLPFVPSVFSHQYIIFVLTLASTLLVPLSITLQLLSKKLIKISQALNH